LIERKPEMSSILEQLNRKNGSDKKSKEEVEDMDPERRHTIGKGNKGQKARTGGRSLFGLKAGRHHLLKESLYQRFCEQNKTEIITLNLSKLEAFLNSEKNIDIDKLKKLGVINKNQQYEYVKILGRGEINNAVKFKGFLYSLRQKRR